MNIHTGAKFFRFIEGQEEPEIIRISTADEIKVKYFDKSGQRHTMPYKELADNYRQLRADGIITFSIVSVGEASDVLVALKSLPSETIPASMRADIPNNIPYAVCRQSIFDFFTNNMKKTDGVVYVGVSVNQDTCPANIDFNDMLTCTGLKYNRPVAVYLDDTLEDILKLFNHKKYNDALVALETASKHQPQFKDKAVLGLNKTLKELLVNNNFMYDFRKCFGITEVPFHIDEESEGLSMENIIFLENELKVNIMETYLIRYTREIDLRSIKRDYLLVTSAADKFSKVYIVGYDTADGEYVPRATV